MTKKIVFFNGPPSSGKDTFAGWVVEYANKCGISASHHRVKEQLIELTCLIYNVDRSVWDECYTTEGKEIRRDWLMGRSQREALIHTSETVFKPNYGERYFGDCALKRVINDKWATLIAFSDGGFVSEIESVADHYGTENVAIVRLHRDGFTFDGDSRSYLSFDGVATIDVTTGGDITTTGKQIFNHIAKWSRYGC